MKIKPKKLLTLLVSAVMTVSTLGSISVQAESVVNAAKAEATSSGVVFELP